MRKALTVMASPPGVGKTTFSLQLAVRFAMGLPWLGFEPIRTGPVVVVNGEEPLDELKRRFLAACIEADVDPMVAAKRVLLISGFERPIKLVRQDKQRGVLRTDDVRLLHETIRAHKGRLAILDPLVDLHGVEEKDNTALAEFMQVLRELAGENDMAVMAFSHVPKAAISETSAGDLTAIRGGGAIGGAARIAYTLYPMTKDEAAHRRLSLSQAADYVRLDNAKASMTRRDTDAVWLRRESLSLDNAADGYPADEMGVLVPVDEDEFKTDGPKARNVLQCLIWEQFQARPAGSVMAVSEVARAVERDRSNVSKALKDMATEGLLVSMGTEGYKMAVVGGMNMNFNEIEA
jgi:RecA-family ATPase